jgi:hypothetical protein
VKGRAPVPVFAPVRADSAVEVEPSTAVIGEMVVVGGATVEPSEPTAVLATVVAGEIAIDVVLVELVGDTEVLVVAAIVVVVAPVVVVVRSVVVVVVVEDEQVDTNVTEVDAAAWKPSGHVACSDNMTSPVNPPGTMVVAEVWPLLATSE